MFSLNKQDDLGKIVEKGQLWWDNNCLYLDAQSRESFRSSLITCWLMDRSTSSSERREVFKQLTLTGKHLIEGVNLPFLGNAETKDVRSKDRGVMLP